MDQAYCPTTLVKESPELRIVLITSSENLGYVRAMLAVGVLGYVLRKSVMLNYSSPSAVWPEATALLIHG